MKKYFYTKRQILEETGLLENQLTEAIELMKRDRDPLLQIGHSLNGPIFFRKQVGILSFIKAKLDDGLSVEDAFNAAKTELENSRNKEDIPFEETKTVSQPIIKVVPVVLAEENLVSEINIETPVEVIESIVEPIAMETVQPAVQEADTSVEEELHSTETIEQPTTGITFEQLSSPEHTVTNSEVANAIDTMQFKALTEMAQGNVLNFRRMSKRELAFALFGTEEEKEIIAEGVKLRTKGKYGSGSTRNQPIPVTTAVEQEASGRLVANEQNHEIPQEIVEVPSTESIIKVETLNDSFKEITVVENGNNVIKAEVLNEKVSVFARNLGFEKVYFVDEDREMTLLQFENLFEEESLISIVEPQVQTEVVEETSSEGRFFSVASLINKTNGELVDLAKSIGLKYFRRMQKEELRAALSNPSDRERFQHIAWERYQQYK